MDTDNHRVHAGTAGEDAWPTLDPVTQFSEQLGERLRYIRRQRGLTRQDVARLSNQEFKPAGLGTYERGERAVSLPRLRRIAEIYQVPIDVLLPPAEAGRAELLQPEPDDRIVIDVPRLSRLTGTEFECVATLIREIRTRRQDFDSGVVTLRRIDKNALATMLGVPRRDIAAHLASLDLLAAAPGQS